MTMEGNVAHYTEGVIYRCFICFALIYLSFSMSARSVKAVSIFESFDPFHGEIKVYIIIERSVFR